MCHTDLNQHFGIDAVKALAAKAQKDSTFCESLFATATADDGRCSRNSAWVLTHLPKDCNTLIESHRESLTKAVLRTSDSSLRRLLLTLMERLPWDKEHLRTDLLDFCLLHLVDPAEPYGVRALCAKLAWAQCRHYTELRAELHTTLTLIEPHTISPGLRNTRTKILKSINNNTEPQT